MHVADLTDPRNLTMAGGEIYRRPPGGDFVGTISEVDDDSEKKTSKNSDNESLDNNLTEGNWLN